MLIELPNGAHIHPKDIRAVHPLFVTSGLGMKYPSRAKFFIQLDGIADPLVIDANPEDKHKLEEARQRVISLWELWTK